MFVARRTVRSFVLVLTVAFAGCQNSAKPPDTSSKPSIMSSVIDAVTGQSQETRFCQIIKNVPIERQRLENEQSEINQHSPLKANDLETQVRAVYPKMFENLYALVGPSGTFTNWHGKITARIDNSATKRGKQVFVLSFVPDCAEPDPNTNTTPMLTLSTLQGVAEDTNIDPNSPLGRSLRDMDFSNKKFTVSGQFIWAPHPGKGTWVNLDDSRHFYPTGGFFVEGYLNFVVRFNSIS